jgi:hypothetical protein
MVRQPTSLKTDRLNATLRSPRGSCRTKAQGTSEGETSEDRKHHAAATPWLAFGPSRRLPLRALSRQGKQCPRCC